MNPQNWADAKRYLAEDILIYFGILLISCFWDLAINLAIAVNLYSPSHESVHPYQIGAAQIIVIVFALLQLVRKLKDWQYWR